MIQGETFPYNAVLEAAVVDCAVVTYRDIGAYGAVRDLNTFADVAGGDDLGVGELVFFGIVGFLQ